MPVKVANVGAQAHPRPVQRSLSASAAASLMGKPVSSLEGAWLRWDMSGMLVHAAYRRYMEDLVACLVFAARGQQQLPQLYLELCQVTW